MTPLSEATLRAALPGKKTYELTDATKRGEGALIVRIMPSGSRYFYYRYFANGDRKYISIGRHQDRPDDGGLTLKEARQKAAEHKNTRREHGDPKLKRLEQERANQEKRRELEIESRQGTFQQLIDAYIAKLEADGKPSAHDTRITLDLHVTKAWPELVKLKAKEITPEDISQILAGMIRKGIERRTNIVRSMLHAAFTTGGKSDFDPKHLATNGVKFGLPGNPVTIVPRQAEYDRAKVRVLTDAELRHLWHDLDRHSTTLRNGIRLALLFGGQRITQLTRSKWTDYNKDKNLFLLRDSKGQGDERPHLLPISEWAVQLLGQIEEKHDFIFATKHGSEVTVEHLSGIVSKIAKRANADYTLGDLRRTAETRLASFGIDLETRSYLMSHGRNSGVQKKHYDMWEYLPEKRAALAKWEAHLKGVLFEQESEITQAA